MTRKTRGQPLSDHARNSHPGDDLTMEDLSMKVSGQYRGALSRLVSEGIQIERILQKRKIEPSRVEVLNSKLNFNQARPIRMRVTDRAF